MKNAKVNVEIGNFGIGEIKKLLWRLCYDPEVTLEEIKLEKDVVIADVKTSILQQAREKFGIKFLFAGKEPYAGTFGIDLGIKDPVVRDTVIYKCYKFVENAKNDDVSKAVGLLKTDPESEKAEARLVGGLKALGFGNKAAKYLYETCCLYPISLLLARMLEEEAEETEAEEGAGGNTVICASNTNFRPAKVGVEKETTVSTELYVRNKAEIKELFAFGLAIETTKEEVEKELENAKKELERLEKIMELITGLEENGLTLEDVLAKKEKLTNFFTAMEEL